MKQHIIASTGGKGGTGKSTFAILLAFKLAKEGEKVLLCDCDVECPNDYLILNKKAINLKPIYQEFPELEKEKCRKCGLCSKICRSNAILWVKEKYPIFFHELCNSCAACWISCPENAIKTRKKIVGWTFINYINDNFLLFTGKSKPGIAETGLIVREVKKRAIEFSNEINSKYLLVDTAPGTHCNVIQALLDCEKAYVVTEPTPLGAYDVKLILEILKIMGIRSEIVLNKSNIGSKNKIKEIAEEYNVPIAIEIPYSNELIKAYCERNLNKVIHLLNGFTLI
jgi:MinD superfamily P-loop ATPase